MTGFISPWGRLATLVQTSLLFVISVAFYISLTWIVPERLSIIIEPGRGEQQEFIVEPGMGALAVARLAEKEGLTDSSSELACYLYKLGIDRSIRPGIYSIRPGSPWEIARQIERSVPEVSSVTVIPGESLPEMARKLGEMIFEALEKDSLFPEEMQRILPDDTWARVGFILPDTYSVSPTVKATEELVKSASTAWWKKIGSVLDEEFERDRNIFLKTAILASMIEKEARHEEERAIIAGVIANRERSGMKLQIDATVVYAWALKGQTLERVLYSHLEIDSPYNTYLHSGYPPAPICVPSESSWRAAMDPASVPFVYYVARPDGSHYFSISYNEHLRAVKMAREEFSSTLKRLE
ncbi:MAG TPA: endolytic transglycosylase MltG [Synergistetes bacterium]|nr:endolytic transglycosylase MltG [Synergistota bacterium]